MKAKPRKGLVTEKNIWVKYQHSIIFIQPKSTIFLSGEVQHNSSNPK